MIAFKLIVSVALSNSRRECIETFDMFDVDRNMYMETNKYEKIKEKERKRKVKRISKSKLS